MPIRHNNLVVHSGFAFPVICKNFETKKNYLAQFAGAGVEVRPMIAGNMQNQPFYKKYTNQFYDLPGTDKIDRDGFYYGNYPDLTETDLKVLSSCLQGV